jgi:glutamate 5-kinase
VERNEPDTTAQALALADADHVRVVAAARRIVIKVGSSLVTDEGRGLDRAAISRWGAEIASLRAGGKQVVVVSSGAVAEGMKRLGWRQRPSYH